MRALAGLESGHGEVAHEQQEGDAEDVGVDPGQGGGGGSVRSGGRVGVASGKGGKKG